MTFIASVVAKNGLAVVADSLVSSFEYGISLKKWNDFIKDKKSTIAKDADFKLTEEEINKLFISKPAHTKDYEDKLFQYDKYTAITTAGAAAINNKRIADIIVEIKKKTQKNKGYNHQKIETKVSNFCNALENEIKEHIAKHKFISQTTFLISNYNKSNRKSFIFKVTVQLNNSATLLKPDCKLTITDPQLPVVVCDGQPNVAHRILYGGVLDILTAHSKLIGSTKDELIKLGIKEKKGLPENFFAELTKKQTQIILEIQKEEVQMNKLNNLSLQQAADLAFLLLKVERDFQACTKNIPTVGGVIKLAIIDDEGFKFILGNGVIKPTRHL